MKQIFLTVAMLFLFVSCGEEEFYLQDNLKEAIGDAPIDEKTLEDKLQAPPKEEVVETKEEEKKQPKEEKEKVVDKKEEEKEQPKEEKEKVVDKKEEEKEQPKEEKEKVVDKKEEEKEKEPKKEEEPKKEVACYEDKRNIEGVVSEVPKKKVDILIVTDSSVSLRNERSSIVKGFYSVLDKYKDVDFNIGVMLAHSEKSKFSGVLYKRSNEPVVLKSELHSMEVIKDRLEWKLRSPHGEGLTDGGEVGMLSLLEAFKDDNFAKIKSEGMFRKDASVAILLVSDEQDICAKLPRGISAVVDHQNKEKMTFVEHCVKTDQSWKDVIIGGHDYEYKVTPELVVQKAKAKLGEQSFFFGGVLYDENSKIPSGNEDEIGYGHLELVKLTGGKNIDLSGGDYVEGLKAFTNRAVASVEYNNVFALKHDKVDINSIQVFLENEAVNFSYDEQSNKLTVDSKELFDGKLLMKYCEM